jgi:polygalacturonase
LRLAGARVEPDAFVRARRERLRERDRRAGERVDEHRVVLVIGDDCISIKSGRGMEGYTLLRTSEDILITNCTFADSIFACIGIGSETSGGIRNVRIEHCKFTRAQTYAIYIKSRAGRGAFIEDITASDLDVSGATGGFLRLNLLNSGLQDQYPVPGLEGIPTARNFRFSNIRVRGVPVLVDATSIHPDKPLDGFSLAGVTGTAANFVLHVSNLMDRRRPFSRGAQAFQRRDRGPKRAALQGQA